MMENVTFKNKSITLHPPPRSQLSGSIKICNRQQQEEKKHHPQLDCFPKSLAFISPRGPDFTDNLSVEL